MAVRRRVYILVIFVVLLALSAGSVPVAAFGQGSVREVKLAAHDPTPGAEFGRSVAIDGEIVAVGAGGANAGSVINAGAVYLFKRHGQGYVPEAKLVAPDATAMAEFGRAVAIRGNTIIVGARFAQVGDLTKAGAAYVFRKYQGSWHFEQKITSPTPANEDNFARALAIQGDLLVVTARKENLNAADVGAAYVFIFKSGSWKYQEKLTASDPAPGAYFGQSVALHGNVLAIGARNADPNAAGAVYVFRQSGNSWTEVTKVIPPDGKKDDQFAFTIAISGDVMTVGARRADPAGLKDAGAAYVYSLRGHSVDLVTRLTASDMSAGDEFGQSVTFAGDSIAVGAWRDDIDGKANQGSIYLFRQMSGQWLETDKLTASDALAGDEFGYSLSAFGNHLVTGAHFAASTAGAAYLIRPKP